MIFRSIVLLLLFVSAGRSVADTVLVLGDSLSAGFGIAIEEVWPSLLQDRLDEQGYGHRVVNASMSGETTGGGLSRLPRALELHGPTVVIVELGGNDGLRGLPIAEIRDNMTEIIEMIRAADSAVVLTGIEIPPNYGPIYTKKFRAIFRDLAETHEVPLIPFLLDGVALDATLMQPDGIHPTADAQPLILENVWRVLGPELDRRLEE